MPCIFARELSGLYVRSQLSPRDEAAYEAHMSHCIECVQAVETATRGDSGETDTPDVGHTPKE